MKCSNYAQAEKVRLGCERNGEVQAPKHTRLRKWRQSDMQQRG